MMNLQNIRKTKGLTQIELAELSGVKRGTIQHYEAYSGSIVRPDMAIIKRLAEALGVKETDIFVKDEIKVKKEIKTFECQNQACLLNKKCKCNNDVVIQGKAPCFGKDRVKDKVKYKSGWVGMAGRWEDYR